jgi:hypothetical protein
MKNACAFVVALSVGFALAARAEEAPVSDQAAMMEKAMALSSPSAAHEVLKPYEGTWAYTAKFWMAPGGQPDDMSGTSKQKLIHGGRFLKQKVHGSWHGEEFEGTGHLGYDNVREEYVSVWIDGMSTGIMVGAGQYDAATKSITETCSVSCPMTGEKARRTRNVLSAVENDRYTYTSYAPGPDGQEFMMMEITYTRAP